MSILKDNPVIDVWENLTHKKHHPLSVVDYLLAWLLLLAAMLIAFVMLILLLTAPKPIIVAFIVLAAAMSPPFLIWFIKRRVYNKATLFDKIKNPNRVRTF
jgi:hypothetical protein